MGEKKDTKLLIYMGPHDSVTFADTGQIAERHGDPVEREDHKRLTGVKLDDGEPQWVEADPEPKRKRASDDD